MKFNDWLMPEAVLVFLAYLWSLLSAPTQEVIAYCIFGTLLLLAIYFFSAFRFGEKDAV